MLAAMTDLWPRMPVLLALCIPTVLAWAAISAAADAPFRRVSAAAWMSAALAALTAIAAAWTSGPGPGMALGRLVRVDALTVIMLLLVCTLAVVIVRYSRSYLCGEPGQLRYARALAATLASVTTVVIANDLLLIAAAWIGTSVALHQLLTFFHARTAALVAAHKKFILSRLADACVLTAIGLIGAAVGSLELDAVEAWSQQHAQLSPGVQAAAVLLVVAVALKSAQLPFHGWLTQVMEAPTPVSALLHAGVVNIGGFLMIRLAPVMAQAHVAQTLLVVVGTITAVVAALVVHTRVSVKVALAWSTCAQMGFMLVECGLGLWSLALLHLVAHSLYKAHAFLAAGSAVDGWRLKALAPRQDPPSLARAGAAALLAMIAMAAVGALAMVSLGAHAAEFSPLTLVLGLGLAPLVASAAGLGWRSFVRLSLAAVGVMLLYTGGHLVAARVLAPSPMPSSDPIAWTIALTGFVLLFGLQVAMQARPRGRIALALEPWLHAGLYLDEIFTRMTFQIWPPRLPPRALAEQRRPITETVEA